MGGGWEQEYSSVTLTGGGEGQCREGEGVVSDSLAACVTKGGKRDGPVKC